MRACLSSARTCAASAASGVDGLDERLKRPQSLRESAGDRRAVSARTWWWAGWRDGEGLGGRGADECGLERTTSGRSPVGAQHVRLVWAERRERDRERERETALARAIWRSTFRLGAARSDSGRAQVQPLRRRVLWCTRRHRPPRLGVERRFGRRRRTEADDVDRSFRALRARCTVSIRRSRGHARPRNCRSGETPSCARALSSACAIAAKITVRTARKPTARSAARAPGRSRSSADRVLFVRACHSSPHAMDALARLPSREIADVMRPTMELFQPLLQVNAGFIDAVPRSEHAYGSHPRQTLDVFTPDASIERPPVLLFVPGGGLVAGSKDMYLSELLVRSDGAGITTSAHSSLGAASSPRA